nr:MAG TPA: hypothetical protein [Crassvirales sp.]
MPSDPLILCFFGPYTLRVLFLNSSNDSIT